MYGPQCFYECRNAPLSFAKQKWSLSDAAHNVFTGVGMCHCYRKTKLGTYSVTINFYKCRNMTLLLKSTKNTLDKDVSKIQIDTSMLLTARRRRKIW